jgi:hypothetical protein
MRSDHHLAVDPVDHHRRQMRKQNPRQQHVPATAPESTTPNRPGVAPRHSGARGFTESAPEPFTSINDIEGPK